MYRTGWLLLLFLGTIYNISGCWKHRKAGRAASLPQCHCPPGLTAGPATPRPRPYRGRGASETLSPYRRSRVVRPTRSLECPVTYSFRQDAQRRPPDSCPPSLSQPLVVSLVPCLFVGKTGNLTFCPLSLVYKISACLVSGIWNLGLL